MISLIVSGQSVRAGKLAYGKHLGRILVYGKVQGFRQKLREAGKIIYRRLNQLSGGILEILVDTVKSFVKARGAEAAASMAYYVIFSLFPLLLSIIAIGGIFLQGNDAWLEDLNQVVRVAIPVAANLIIENINEILKRRGQIGLIGIVGLLWSASAAFAILFRNINRAWAVATPLNSVKSRLVALTFIMVIGVSLSFSLFARAILDLLPFLEEILTNNGTFFESSIWLSATSLVPMVISFFLFLWLYWWIPNTKVKLREAFWAALLAAVTWEITTRVFTWFLRSGLVNYELVYGTLGSVVALLFWIYLNNLILIFCAHLSATIAHHTRLKHLQGSKPVVI